MKFNTLIFAAASFVMLAGCSEPFTPAQQTSNDATIVGARIQFTADETSSVATGLKIEAEASDDAPSFVRADRNVTSRPRTNGSIAWAPPPWTKTGASGPDQRTPELTGLLQEIVDRAAWSSGNSMAFVITGSGLRTAEAYDGDRDAAAVLDVEYLCEVGPAGGFACEVECEEAALWYADFDGDGYGDASRTASACAQPAGWVADASDCDDFEDSVHPDAHDLCDGIDNDCDTSIDEDFAPQPTSCGVGACAATGDLQCVEGSVVDSCGPGAAEADDAVCNGVDDDCDGVVDEDYAATLTSCGVGACGAGWRVSPDCPLRQKAGASRSKTRPRLQSKP